MRSSRIWTTAGFVVGTLAASGSAFAAPGPLVLPTDAPKTPPPTVATTAPATTAAAPAPKPDPYLTTHTERHKLLQTFAVALRDYCAHPSFDDKGHTPEVANALKGLTVPKATDAPPPELKTLCADLCSDEDGISPKLNMCRFSDAALAHAAVAADWDSVQKVMAYARKQVSSAFTAPVFNALSATSVNGANDGSAAVRLMVSLAVVQQEAAFGAEAAAFTTQIATTALEALAKLVADRAKREVIGFFLDEMGTNLCSSVPSDQENALMTNRERAELRTYWLPALCAQAKASRLSGYGAGSAMLSALRGSVQNDLHAWPGQLAGLGLGAAFWADAQHDTAKPDVFACGDATPDALCPVVGRLRTATATRTNALLDGEAAPTVLYGLAGDIDRNNYHRDGTVPALYSPGLEVLACAASLPLVVEQYGNAMSSGSLANGEGLLLAAMASAPACWTLFGKGISTDTCEWFGGTPKSCVADKLGIDHAGGVERLSTILRLGHGMSSAANNVQSHAQTLLMSVKAYRAAVDALAAASQAPSPNPPSLEIGKDPATAQAAAAAAEAYVRATARLSTLAAVQRVVLATLALADEGIGLAKAMADASAAIPVTTVPGLRDSKAKLTELAAEADARLDALHDALGLVRLAAQEDWTSMVAQALRLTQSALTPSCGSNPSSCAKPMTSTTRYAGVLVAMVTAHDPDELAAVLDDAATPPGGWRDKGVPGRRTVSITAHPGLFGALELRRGPYGVIENNFERVYGQAPTLAMPVGVEFAFGNACKCFDPISLFFPVIDPAAYLQYDTSQGGRLPGARLLTALSPGVGLRFGIAGTPFGIMPTFVYRPGFRAWDSSVGGSGADAFQVGINLSIDVTLLNLSKSGGK